MPFKDPVASRTYKAAWRARQPRRARPALEQRFWRRVDQSGDCWLWTGATQRGYGVISHRDELRKAHRVSFEIHNGPIPNGLWVLHRCDVKACVRPDHLFLGDVRDNVADAAGKGILARARRRIGKLTWEDAQAIRRRRADGERAKDLAAEYGVHPSLVSRIAGGAVWTRPC